MTNIQKTNITNKAKLKNLKAKSGLDKSMLDTLCYEFLSFLECKAMQNGKIFIKAPPQYASKTCNVCGNVKENLTLKR